jgi:hypothetical protein
MTGSLAFVWLWCALAVGPGSSAPLGSVRAGTARLRLAVDRSLMDSRTFSALAATLTRHHVIVYIVSGACDFGHRDACLLHYASAGSGYRYLRIVVRDTAPPARLAGQIAHELQHAVEVAESSASDGNAVAALFLTLGTPCPGQYARACYETRDAIEVQHQVLKEIEMAPPRIK